MVGRCTVHWVLGVECLFLLVLFFQQILQTGKSSPLDAKIAKMGGGGNTLIQKKNWQHSNKILVVWIILVIFSNHHRPSKHWWKVYGLEHYFCLDGVQVCRPKGERFDDADGVHWVFGIFFLVFVIRNLFGLYYTQINISQNKSGLCLSIPNWLERLQFGMLVKKHWRLPNLPSIAWQCSPECLVHRSPKTQESDKP